MKFKALGGVEVGIQGPWRIGVEVWGQTGVEMFEPTGVRFRYNHIAYTKVL